MYLTSIYNSNLLINLNNIKKKLDEKQNIDDYLKYILKKTIGNKCNKDGLIIKSSIEIINRNVGSFNLNSDLLYKIQYKANILAPNEGCVLENCHIVNDNEVFYIAQKKNLHIIILIPKNLITEKLKLNTLQTIVCLDKFYEINDNYIFIIGVPIDKSKMNIDKIKLEDSDDEKCKETIKHFPDCAVISNSARGDMIDDNAMVDALKNGVDQGGIDPLTSAPDNGLITSENVSKFSAQWDG